MFEFWFDYFGWCGIGLGILNTFVAPFHRNRLAYWYIAALSFLGPLIAAVGQGTSDAVQSGGGGSVPEILVGVSWVALTVLGGAWCGTARGDDFGY